jgi:hypothetical protein
LVDLKSYYPLSYATDNYFIEGATTIVYNDAGTSPVYYKDPYKVYNWSNKEIVQTSNWVIDDEAKCGLDVVPKITNNTLRPCVMYISDVNM